MLTVSSLYIVLNVILHVPDGYYYLCMTLFSISKVKVSTIIGKFCCSVGLYVARV